MNNSEEVIRIPDFLRRENVKENNSEFAAALERYEEHFHDSPTTEMSSFTDEEWVAILDHCIKTNTPYPEEELGEDEYI